MFIPSEAVVICILIAMCFNHTCFFSCTAMTKDKINEGEESEIIHS